MSQPPPRISKPTIVGLPAFVPSQEEPFPLTPYADVHVYTPSRERTIGGERTPIMLPPATRVARKQDPTILMRRERATEPSFESKLVACAVVIWVIGMATVALMF